MKCKLIIDDSAGHEHLRNARPWTKTFGKISGAVLCGFSVRDFGRDVFGALGKFCASIVARIMRGLALTFPTGFLSRAFPGEVFHRIFLFLILAVVRGEMKCKLIIDGSAGQEHLRQPRCWTKTFGFPCAISLA